MPIRFFEKRSPEMYRHGWATTRFWLSSFACLLCAGGAVWGGWFDRWQAVAAGSGGAALVAAVYVWAVSRGP